MKRSNIISDIRDNIWYK